MRGLRRKEFETVDQERALELGLTEDEWVLVRTELARDINENELLILAALWSEKGSHKYTGNLRSDLRDIAASQTKTISSGLRTIDLDDGRALAVSLQQNNTESFSAPWNGAAVASALAMDRLIAGGFTPCGISELLRVGDVETAQAQRSLSQMVKGAAEYLNRGQVPRMNVDVYFHQALNEAAVFNAAAIGVCDMSERPAVESPDLNGAPLVFVGLPGAPSMSLDSEQRELKTVVRTGNAYQQYLIAEAIADAYRQGMIVDAVSIGVGGVLPHLFRLAHRNQCGLDVAFDKLPFTKSDASLLDILLCETPHRFLLLVEKQNHRALNDLIKSHGLRSLTVGDATNEPEVNLASSHYIHAGLPYKLVVEGAMHHGMRISRSAPMRKPSPHQRERMELDTHEDLSDRWIDVLAAPNLCSRLAVNQFSDLQAPGGSLDNIGIGASAVSLDPAKGKRSAGLACSLRANCLYAMIDPYMGTVHTVAEAVRSIAAAGGRPIAFGASLNFGSLEDRKTQLALAEACRALGDSSRMWELPLLDEDISVLLGDDPLAGFSTPAVFAVGYLREMQKCTTAWFKKPGDKILVLGAEPEDLACSEYSAYWKQPLPNRVPEIDFEFESRLSSLVAILVTQGLLRSSHASTAGGLAIALAQCCLSRSAQNGVEIDLQSESQLPLETMLFGEAPGQIVVSFRAEDEPQVEELVGEYRVPVLGRGTVGGKTICCRLNNDSCSVSLKSAGKIWSEGLSHIFPMRDDNFAAA